MHRMFLSVVMVAAIALTASAQISTVNLTPVQDNSLYESIVGNLSNGSGDWLFAGQAGPGGGLPRRAALVQFDIAGNVPAGAIIIGATLTANVNNPNGGGGPTTLTLHPVVGSWGEEGSDAPSGEGGGGTAMTGDATWLHRHFPTVFWNTPGGDFGPSSASVSRSTNGSFNWPSTAGTIGDVQNWLDDPCHNFGWLVNGNGGPAKRFESRENPTSANHPTLEVVYVSGSVTPKYVGNTPELVIDVSVNGCASGNGSGVHNVVTGLNDIVTLNFNSPGNTYTGQGFFATLQPFVTGMTTGDAGGPVPLPLGGGTLLHLDLSNTGSIVVLANSLGGGGIFTQVIAPQADISFVVPPPFVGLSFVTVCLITDFSIPGDLIAVADSQELVIQ